MLFTQYAVVCELLSWAANSFDGGMFPIGPELPLHHAVLGALFWIPPFLPQGHKSLHLCSPPRPPPPPPPLIYSTLFSSPLSLPPFPHLSKFWAIDMLNTYSEIYTCRSVPVICISHCFLFLAGQCVFIFLPPKYHILMKFCCHTTSTAISIATDNWKLLSLINSFLHA